MIVIKASIEGLEGQSLNSMYQEALARNEDIVDRAYELMDKEEINLVLGKGYKWQDVATVLVQLTFQDSVRSEQAYSYGAAKKVIKRYRWGKERAKVTKDVKMTIYKAYNGKCCRCGKELETWEMTIDHILPISRGGTSDIDNLQLMCKSCNSKKGTRIYHNPQSYHQGGNI